MTKNINNSPDPQLVSLLFLNGDIPGILKLLEEYEFSNILDNGNSNLLHASCDFGYSSIVEFLFKNSFKFDINLLTYEQNTSLHLAIERGHLNIAKILLNNKANVNFQNIDKETPLHLASKNENIAAIKLLIENGSNIHAKNINGRTPFHCSFESQILELFIVHGVDINTQDNYGSTLLHLACVINNINIVEFLINNNADIYKKDNQGNTVFHKACITNNTDIVQFLLSKNIDISIQNNNNQTGLDLAITQDNYNAITIIESYQNYNELNKSLTSLEQITSIKKPKL